MRKLWIFGCSFSSGFAEVPRENTYGNLLGSELDYEVMNLSECGNSNDKILYDLIGNLKNIQDGDLILYQFSLFNRIGFFINHSSYVTTAGLIDLGLEHKLTHKQPPKEDFYRNTDIKHLETLLDYTTYWHKHRMKFDYDESLNILNFLRSEKNVDYIILNMGEEIINQNKDTLIMPTWDDHNNISMLKFAVHNKLTVSDEFPENHRLEHDTHPGFEAHRKIKNLILQKINSK